MTTNTTPAPKPTFASSLESVLKDPLHVLASLRSGPVSRTVLFLAATAFVCLLGFGFVIGTMSGGTQLWAAPIKVAAGTFASALICFPSLYVFSALAGLDLRPATLAGLLAAALCLASLLLAGFAPVAFLFAQSTSSTLFFGILCLAICAIALFFGLALLRRFADQLNAPKRTHLIAWATIFTLVTIQMSTALRPIIGSAPTFLPEEKKFFLEHWFSEIDVAGRSLSPPTPDTAPPVTSAARPDHGDWK